VVDFAAMRDAVKNLGGDPELINPQCPSDLVIDHSVQVRKESYRKKGMCEGKNGSKLCFDGQSIYDILIKGYGLGVIAGV